jgi:EAL domain-containing protein (putative c-di-GMP-specific phosphodiesterase class I)/putative methionine-R-sulfoxide reductase with GAF domain
VSDEVGEGPADAGGVAQRAEAVRGGEERLGELIRQTIDPLQLMQRVADQLVAMVDAADGAMVGLQIDERSLRFVCAAGHLTRFVGQALPMDRSLSGRTIRSGRTHITEDTERDGRVHLNSTRAFNIRSSICVPLGREDHRVGVLNLCSTRAGAFAQADVDLLAGLAEFISTVIGAATDLMTITARLCGLHRPGGTSEAAHEPLLDDAALAGRFVANVLDPAGAERVVRRERIERAIAEHQFTIVFQPIFDLSSGGVSGVEALARFTAEPYRAPDVWVEEAHQAGLGVELELALMKAAVEHLEQIPPRAVLTLNAGPDALSSAAVAQTLAGADPARLVIELTEHVVVEDYPALDRALAGLRTRGMRLAIDDAGAGFASLMHILRLAPEFIKLDRQLISGIDRDPVRRSLTGSLMRFAEETGATIVAEGVETGSELSVLDELGIRHAQGFYLARPVPIEELRMAGLAGAGRVRRKTHRASRGGGRAPRVSSLRA